MTIVQNDLRPSPPRCHYCRLRPAGSREHLPGVAALNDAPVEITYLRVPHAGAALERARRVEDYGLVVRTICRHCNERTGGNYGTAFKEFALQFASSGVLDAGQRRCWVSLQDIQPLRVLKQMAAMFLAVQPTMPPPVYDPIRDFVLTQGRKLPPDLLRVFLYRNVSHTGRIVPVTGLGFLRAPPESVSLVCSEISWPPLGLVFARHWHPHLAAMPEITHWGQRFHFRQRASLGFSVPQLRVETTDPLGFGSPEEVDRWSSTHHVAVVMNTQPGEDIALGISALVRQQRRPPR